MLIVGYCRTDVVKDERRNAEALWSEVNHTTLFRDPSIYIPPKSPFDKGELIKGSVQI